MGFLRKFPDLTPPFLAEIVTPRVNAAPLSAMQTCLAGIALAEPVSLELWGTSRRRWFLARAHTDLAHAHLTSALGAAYPQAELRVLDLAQRPRLDPAVLRAEEQVRACELVLEEPPYLPLRIFEDGRGDVGRSLDPLVGVLAALGSLPDGWRAVSQIVLAPAPETWAAPYKTLALTPPPSLQRQSSQADTSLTPVFLLAGAMLLLAFGVWTYQQVLDGAWLSLAGALLLVALLLWPAVRLARRLLHKPVYDPQLVGDKIAYPAFRCQLRLAVFAPKDAPPQQVEAHLARLVVAYRPFHRPSGNRFQARWLPDRDLRLDQARFIGASHQRTLLNVRELAGLWHIPRVETDLPLVERTAARRWLPLPPPRLARLPGRGIDPPGAQRPRRPIRRPAPAPPAPGGQDPPRQVVPPPSSGSLPDDRLASVAPPWSRHGRSPPGPGPGGPGARAPRPPRPGRLPGRGRDPPTLRPQPPGRGAGLGPGSGGR